MCLAICTSALFRQDALPKTQKKWVIKKSQYFCTGKSF